MQRTLLIIDDDVKLTSLLTQYFSKQNFKVLSANHPDEGMKTLRKGSVDLVILDVMLPDKSGFDVCKEIRRESEVPILMLTAKGEVMDRIVGLEIGADDYVSKPFEPRELLARIESILRRKAGSGRKIFRFKGLAIDINKRSVILAGQPLELSTAEFEALSLLMSRPGEVFNRDQIMERLRGIECDAFNRSIDVLISRLRGRLNDDPKHPHFIKTIWGTGYSFVGEPDESE